MIKKHPYLILCFTTLLLLSACSGAKEQLGLNKEAPDEFAVVRHEPLVMPPSIALPPPRPGMPRPQEQATTVQAQKALFGQDTVIPESKTASGAENVLLQQTNAAAADPNIRQTLATETEELEEQNRPVLDKIMMKSGRKVEYTAETLDPKIEAERLKQKNIPTPEIPAALQKETEKK